MSHSPQEIIQALTSDQRRLLDLIRIYRRGIDIMVGLMQREFGAHPMRARRDGKIPSKGPLKIHQRAHYRIHDHGGVVHFGKMRFEFDFGPTNRCDGFSAILLDRHVQLNKTFRRDFHDLDIPRTLNELLALELVHAPDWEPTPHLMYLTSTGNDVIDWLRRNR